MKKLILLMAGAVVLASCDALSGKKKQMEAENESLKTALAERDAELDDMMATFNDISEGFRQINAAENRVDLNRDAVGEGSRSAKEQIAEDIDFIRKQMEENKALISKLESQLKSSKNQSAQLRKTVENLTKELQEKAQRIEELQQELAAKNIRIQELDAAVGELSGAKKQLETENAMKQKTVNKQDKQIHTAWFVFGTKKELKEQKILTDTGLFKKGKVLKDADFNKDYFTQIDIRTTKEIKLYSRHAQLMTSHPAGSYELVENDKGEKILKIKDADAFWSVSKYLVILV